LEEQHKNEHYDLGKFDLEKEKSLVTLRVLLGDNIRDTNNSHQSPELVVSCPSLRTHFHRNKFFKLHKIRSIKHLPSFPPSCVPNIAIPEIKSFRENYVLCNPYSSRTLVNFSLSDLRNAINNFSNGL